MRDRLIKTSDLLVNASIIVVAILLSVVLVKNYLLPGRGHSLTDESTISPGTKLSLPRVDWSKTEQTVVLVLSESCRYCTESAPFYRRLVASSAGTNPVIAVFPQDVATGRNYLNGLGISVNEIKQVSPESIGTRATPTIVLVNSRGVVEDVWVGKLPPQKEEAVLARLQLRRS